MILSLLKKYIWVINVILIVMIAYVIAGIISNKIKTEINPKRTLINDNTEIENKYKNIKTKVPLRKNYDAIIERNLFGVGIGSEEYADGSLSDDSAPNTSLNLELLGTFLKPDGDSIAIIKNLDNGKIDSYMEGNPIDIITNEKVQMKKVDNCRAVIERRSKGSESILCNKDLKFAAVNEIDKNNRANSIDNNSPAESSDDSEEGIKKVEEGVYQIERKKLDELLEDPSDLIKQARVIPQDDGLRFFGIRPSSIFFKIGLRNGDTLHRINEVALNDVQNALTVFADLKDQSEFSIDFTRRGKKQSNQYSVY
ncbi:MAG: type II secretion system protein GspC [Thermodesulfobacteriota bacterium]